MGVDKRTLKPGNGKDYPAKGDEVTIEYTGNLYDANVGEANHYRGDKYVSLFDPKLEIRLTCFARFDSSVGRGHFKTPIGVGRVIKGMMQHAQSSESRPKRCC